LSHVLVGAQRVAVAEYGAAGGPALVYCHGLPSSRLEAALLEDAAGRAGARVLCFDRPGYGAASPAPGTSLEEVAALHAEAARRLGLGAYHVLGVSGGGPYALALAASAPGEVQAVTVACGLGPVYDPAVTRAMGWVERLGFVLGRRAPGLLAVVYGDPVAAAVRRAPGAALRLLLLRAPVSDRAVLADPRIRAGLEASIREALRQGGTGVRDDFRRYVRDWGGALAGIRCPVSLWHGDADAVVPPAHLDALAARLPAARVHRVPEAGHYALPLGRQEEILGELLAA
jgi:pimeloyl-ACP methyl ester carboxylesterase